MVQHLQPQNFANHEFVWIKSTNLERTLNVVVVYFVSGLRPADNEWNYQLRGELEQIVISLKQSSEPSLILGDFNAHIEIFPKTLIFSSSENCIDSKVNSKNLLGLLSNH